MIYVCIYTHKTVINYYKGKETTSSQFEIGVVHHPALATRCISSNTCMLAQLNHSLANLQDLIITLVGIL